ncbi:unnamed protein product [Wickerhamomyces anomalus]
MRPEGLACVITAFHPNNNNSNKLKMFSIGSFLPQVKNATSNKAPEQEQKQVVLAAPVPEKSSSRDYTMILRNGANDQRDIQSSLDDVIPLRQRQRNISLAMPSEEEVRATTERTRKALDKVLQEKLGKGAINSKDQKKASYVRYTSSNILDDKPSSSRIIKIVDVQEDPMAPKKFKQKKQMARPSSPPAPVLHAPTRKATAEEQKQWYIPPAISNWKNPNGFTISLDKRLAVDGRDPNRDNTEGDVNKNFIDLANALDEADKKAREDIKIRNALRKKLAEKENREKEEKLRSLAQKAREEKMGGSSSLEYENDDARKRAMIREERRKKAEKELKNVKNGTQLGLAKATNSAENQFDSRLFSKSTQVTNSEDQVYDNPLFVQQAVNSIYKVSESNLDNDPDAQLEDMQNEKRFDTLSTSKPSGPVEFHKDDSNFQSSKVDESEYGLQVKRQKR